MNEEIMREKKKWTIFYLLTSASCTENEAEVLLTVSYFSSTAPKYVYEYDHIQNSVANNRATHINAPKTDPK